MERIKITEWDIKYLKRVKKIEADTDPSNIKVMLEYINDEEDNWNAWSQYGKRFEK